MSSELNQYLSTGPYTQYAFEITATQGINVDWAGFAELQFYDCTGTQLVPSASSNPGGDQRGLYWHGPAAAFDGNLNTKWLDGNKQLLIATFSTAVRIASYKWINAEDAIDEPGRTPVSWKLKARLLPSDAWQVLSTVVQHSFTGVNNELVGPFSTASALGCSAGDNGFVRLVGCTSVACRLEVQYQQQWGTVCDDSFSNDGAAVVCRSLGLNTGTNSQKELSVAILYILRR